MAVSVQLYDVDNDGKSSLSIVALTGFPFPGDIIECADGTRVRVIRRSFIEQVKNETALAARFWVRAEEDLV